MWSGGSRSATASRCSSATPPTAGSPPWCCCRWRCCRGRRRRAGRSRSCMDGPGGCAGRCRGARPWPTACTRRRCPTRTGPRCWRPPDPPTARGRTSAACSRASRRPPAGAAKRPGRTSATRPATSDRLGPRPRGGQALRHHRRADPAGLPARPAAGGPGQDHAAGPGRAPAAGPGVARHRGAEPASGGPGRRHGGRGPAHVAGPRRPRRRRGRPRAARACPRRPAFDMTERRLTPASRSAIIAPMRQWGWRAYLFFGAALAVAYYLVPPAFAKLVVWPVIGFSSAAVIVVGIRRNRPDRPLAWYLFAIGQVLFALGDTLYAVRVRVLHDPSTVFPSYIDFLYLAFYPCLAAGLWLLIRRRTPGRDTASLIDATIVSTGLALLALDGTWQQGGPIDLTWIAFYVGWGVAALHPSMAALSRPAPVSVRLPRGRLVLITCASLIPGGAGHPVGAQRAAGRPGDRRRVGRAVPARAGAHERAGGRGCAPARAQAGHAVGAAGDRGGALPAGGRAARRAGPAAHRAALRAGAGAPPRPPRQRGRRRRAAGEPRGQGHRRDQRAAAPDDPAPPAGARRARPGLRSAEPGPDLRVGQRRALRHRHRVGAAPGARAGDGPVPGHAGIPHQREQARQRLQGQHLAGGCRRARAPADPRRRRRLQPPRGHGPGGAGALRPHQHARARRDGRRYAAGRLLARAWHHHRGRDGAPDRLPLSRRLAVAAAGPATSCRDVCFY